jgi:hypothetical protein
VSDVPITGGESGTTDVASDVKRDEVQDEAQRATDARLKKESTYRSGCAAA